MAAKNKQPTKADIKKSARELAKQLGIKTSIKEVYPEILKKINYYLDVSKDSATLLGLWILGTHFHSKFPSYPILYLNAMRGSGKTRALTLASHLSKGFRGVVQNAISQSALFHSKDCLFLDEMETITSREKNELCSVLNSCYKKGAKVTRMVKTKGENKESYVSEEHELYKPVGIANISGIDGVLENRALIIFLEKSFNPIITSRLEDFDTRLEDLKKKLNFVSDGCDTNDGNDGMTRMTEVLQGWNNFVDSLNDGGIKDVQSPSHPSHPSSRHYVLYKKIYDAGISGRTLELCFPLLLVAYFVSDETFNYSLELFSKISKRRRESELDEVHVLIYRFVSAHISIEEYAPASKLFYEFQNFCNFPTGLNVVSFALALERLQLIKDRKRTAHSRLIKLDVERAKQKIGLFDKEASR